jgi:hypothetical protein
MFKSSEYRTAKAVNGNVINVQIIALQRKQNVCGGFKFVDVGTKILLDSGLEVNFNLDGKSFYIAPNEMYRLT